MEKPKSNSAKRKVEEECKLLPLCRAKPSPSFIHLPATNPATCQNNQSAKLQTGVDIKKPQDCLGLLECMHANLQLQTKLAQQQMAILEDLQSSMTLLIPGGEAPNLTLLFGTRSQLSTKDRKTPQKTMERCFLEALLLHFS